MSEEEKLRRRKEYEEEKARCKKRREEVILRRKKEYEEEKARRAKEREEEKIRRKNEYAEYLASYAINRKNQKLSARLTKIKLKEKQKAEKPFLEYQNNIDAFRQGFQSLVDRHMYLKAIKFVRFDLLEKGVFDDLIEDQMLQAYREHYGIE